MVEMKLEEMGKFLVQLPSFVSRFQIQSGERYLLCLEVPLCIAECQTGEAGIRDKGSMGKHTHRNCSFFVVESSAKSGFP